MNDWTGLENSIARWLERGAIRPTQAGSLMQERYHPEVIALRHRDIYREALGGQKIG
jgi:hypothetical protein